MNSALPGVELKLYIYKKPILGLDRGELFFSLSTCVIPFYYPRLFGLWLEFILELHLNCLPALQRKFFVGLEFEGQGNTALSGLGPLFLEYLHYPIAL